MAALAKFRMLNEIVDNSQVQSQQNNSERIKLSSEISSGLKELAKLHFVPAAKPYFERQITLPLLQSTNISILNRLKNINGSKTTKNGRNNMYDKKERPISAEVDFSGCDDLFLLQACCDVILSFMGDNESDLSEKLQNRNPEFIHSTGTTNENSENIVRKRKSSGDNGEPTMQRNPVTKRPASMYVSSDLNGNHQPQKTIKSQTALSSESLSKMTVLEKVHFVANIGIDISCFRDEIICQILKQLVANPSARSTALGWILLSLLLGCFAPSDKILSHVELFLRHQDSPWSSYCLDKMAKTLATGERKNPPCSLELQAAKTKQRMRVPVICMDHSVRTVCADSSTTAADICMTMVTKTNLDDSFGFSLFIALDKKLAPLGHSNFLIMDAISQAERFSKINNVHEMWRICFRREYFSPLDACCLKTDQMKIRFTYYQICGGVQSGEYQYKRPQDLALLIAHQYCVTHGLAKVDTHKVKLICSNALPPSALLDGSKRKWTQMVNRTLKALSTELSRSNKQLDKLDVMKEVVRYGSKSFFENFTKTFLLSTFCFSEEPEKATVNSVMKLNQQRVTVSLGGTSLRKDIIPKPIFDEITKELEEVKFDSKSKDACISLTLQNGKVYEFSSPQKNEIFQILKRYIDEVKFMHRKN